LHVSRLGAVHTIGSMVRKQGEIDPDLEPPVPLRKNRGRPPDPNRTRPTEQRTCPRHGETEFALYGHARPRWRCKRKHWGWRVAAQNEMLAPWGRGVT
jgi:hypothetical protein